MAKEIPDSVKMGSLSVTWLDEGKAFEFQRDGKRYRFDIATLSAPPVSSTNPSQPSPGQGAGRREGRGRRGGFEPLERGRQSTITWSPDGCWKTFYRDCNLWLSSTNDASSTNAIAITTDGSTASRLKYGSANWVYGEELSQRTAIWWATNSLRVAFYRFDESHVQDYFLALDQSRFHDRLDAEPYMKAGATNPLVDLLIYDVKSKQTVRVDVRNGKPFDDQTIGHYIYGVAWTPDGRELLFHRTNRRQNIMELCAADPGTGKVRVIIREEWPASWTENLPTLRFLQDGRRFIWASERTGWRNWYLYDLTSGLVATLTAHPFEVEAIVKVDEPGNRLFYTAHSGDNPMKLQLHCVGLDGCCGRCLTDPAFHHTVDVSPDGRHFIDTAQTHDVAPVTTLRDADGHSLAELAKSDLTRYHKLGLKPVELLQFKAADGVTDLYGLLHFPSNFQPGRHYPLLVSVYGGPATVGARETFTLPNTLTELGFLVASFDSRSANGRGKRFLDSIYQRLGIVEVDDQAAGVKSLWERRYLDRRRVGIFGTSYGGTASAMSLLRHPEVFQAACANSGVMDFRNYDSIYTERYMGLPQESKAAYDAGSVTTYATNLQGRLLIFYGTADNNVHPANSLQLIAALQKAGKTFEVQVGPDQGHSAVSRERMMEFFYDALVVRKPPVPSAKPVTQTRP
jgi:dipeptidyl-peptidase-4